MEKEFVPYELAVKLKDLGFNEICFGRYYNNGKEFIMKPTRSNLEGSYVVSAPLWQQVFDWFREKHKLVGYTGMDLNGTLQPVRYFFAVQKSNLSKDEDHLSRHGYKTYQEASQACLEKLIQIIADENKTNTN